MREASETSASGVPVAGVFRDDAIVIQMFCCSLRGECEMSTNGEQREKWNNWI